MNLNWEYYTWDRLTKEQLYEILRLRIVVFVIEQNCPYQECDNKDQQAFHLCGRNDEGALLAYTRILKPAISYKEASIGRVVTAEIIRGKGVGRELMRESLHVVEQEWGIIPIRISAQEHLEEFYGEFGFKRVSNMYLEDGIPHIEMLKEA